MKNTKEFFKLNIWNFSNGFRLALFLFSVFCFGMKTASAAEVIATSTRSSNAGAGGILQSTLAAQKFIANQDNITRVDLLGTKSISGTRDFFLSIFDVSHNTIATSSATSIGNSYSNFTFTFPRTALTVGNAYYIAETAESGYLYSQYGSYAGTGAGLGYWESGNWNSTTGWTWNIYSDIYYNDTPLYYCGDTSCNNGETCATCAADCGSCGVRDINYFWLNNPYDCSNISTCSIRYYYNENAITSYDYVELRSYSNLMATTSDFVSTSTIFVYGDTSFGKGEGLSVISVVGSSTVSGLQYFDVIGHLAAYYDLPQQKMVQATTTIPYVLAINWIDGQIMTEYIFATSTDDFDTYALACTPTEWLGATSSWFDLNIPKTICETKKWLLDLGVRPTTYVITKINSIKAKIMGVFPFSLFKTFNDGWKSATNGLTSLIGPKTAYATTTATFATSTGIYDSGTSGDGYSLLIPNFLGSAGTTTIKIFSKSGIVGYFGQMVFDIYYWSCRILVWGLFVNYLWHLITARMSGEIL